MSESNRAPTEDSPLLLDPEAEADLVYQRFSARQKRAILAVVSWAGIIPLFASGSFVPSIAQIARDLNTTNEVIGFAISLSVFGTALGGLISATYATFYGRRPVYVYGLPVYCIGTLGVAFAGDISQLMFWRLVQGMGSSGGLSVGSAVIGDIFQLEERGTAMGIFFASCLLGPAIAPFSGGVATHYFSWRHMQYALFLHGLTAFCFVVILLPETSHPMSRGIDKYMEPPNAPPRPWKWVWINPFRSLLLLRNPAVMAVCLAGYAALLTDYVLLIPLAYTIGKQYHITNEALIGACFLPAGMGNLVGAPLAGRISDYVVTQCRKRRGGKWVPEDRLRATLWGAATLTPLSVLASGFLTQYVEGPVGLTLNLVCLFLNGLGVELVFSPSAAYNVDAMQSRSAEVLAASSAFRAMLIAITIPAIFPHIVTYGVAVTNGISAMIAWLGFGLLWCTIQYGAQMRSWSRVE